MPPHIEKVQRKTSGSTGHGRTTKRPRLSARTGPRMMDILMHSPSPRSPPQGGGTPSPDKDQTLINRKNDNDEEWTDDESITGDDAYFHWEEEATLLSDLLEEATPEAGDAKLIALAESLQKPFYETSRELKKEIASTFVPLVNKVKGVYATLDKSVDIPFGAGLLMFNEGCKEMEKATASEVSVVQKLHSEHRTRIGELLQELEDEYAHREQLWANFKKSVDELVDPILEMLNEAPAKMERLIASIEKQSRALEKEGGSAPADVTEMRLKDLISKLK